jgi:hypothetical protein
MADPTIIRNRIAESVRTMKGLHAVVSGVALTSGLRILIDASQTISTLERVVWFIALVVTIVPFYHGALRHMDDVHLHQDPTATPPREGALLLDFTFLFGEACALYYLSQTIPAVSRFVPAYAILLALDVVWAISVYFMSKRFATVRAWMIINLVSVVLVLIIAQTADLTLPGTRHLVLGLVITRTIVDYSVSWSFYFPSVPNVTTSQATARV